MHSKRNCIDLIWRAILCTALILWVYLNRNTIFWHFFLASAIFELEALFLIYFTWGCFLASTTNFLNLECLVLFQPQFLVLGIPCFASTTIYFTESISIISFLSDNLPPFLFFLFWPVRIRASKRRG